jgi:hypothetical protein
MTDTQTPENILIIIHDSQGSPLSLLIIDSKIKFMEEDDFLIAEQMYHAIKPHMDNKLVRVSIDSTNVPYGFSADNAIEEARRDLLLPSSSDYAQSELYVNPVSVSNYKEGQQDWLISRMGAVFLIDDSAIEVHTNLYRATNPEYSGESSITLLSELPGEDTSSSTLPALSESTYIHAINEAENILAITLTSGKVIQFDTKLDEWMTGEPGASLGPR